jgi:hypothetical protein
MSAKNACPNAALWLRIRGAPEIKPQRFRCSVPMASHGCPKGMWGGMTALTAPSEVPASVALPESRAIAAHPWLREQMQTERIGRRWPNLTVSARPAHECFYSCRLTGCRRILRRFEMIRQTPDCDKIEKHSGIEMSGTCGS